MQESVPFLRRVQTKRPRKVMKKSRHDALLSQGNKSEKGFPGVPWLQLIPSNAFQTCQVTRHYVIKQSYG